MTNEEIDKLIAIHIMEQEICTCDEVTYAKFESMHCQGCQKLFIVEEKYCSTWEGMGLVVDKVGGGLVLTHSSLKIPVGLPWICSFNGVDIYSSSTGVEPYHGSSTEAPMAVAKAALKLVQIDI